MQNSKVFKAAAFVTGILLFSKVFGFLRDVALAYAFGASVESDAFVLSQSVMGMFGGVLYIAFGLAFIPVFTELSLDGSREKERDLINAACCLGAVAFAVIAVLGILFGSGLVSLFAPGFSARGHRIATALVQICMPSIILSFLIAVQGQALRAKNIFLPAAFAPVPLNLMLIAAFCFFSHKGIYAAAWAWDIGVVSQFLWQYFFFRKLGYGFSLCFDIHNDSLKKILILTGPIMLGNAIQSINSVIDKILASGLAEGSMAALNFSNKLAVFIVGLISLGAGNVCYTKMSELGAAGKYGELAIFLRHAVNLLNLIAIPASAGMLALSRPITETVFEYGAFDSGASAMTAAALCFYTLGICGYALRDILTRAFYSVQDSQTPMVNGLMAVVLNIALNLILVRYMGICGLALATSVSAVAGTAFLLFGIRRKFGGIGGREMAAAFLKCCTAAAIMGICVHFGYLYVYGATGIVPLALAVNICMGIVIYGIVICFMGIKEVGILKEVLKNKVIKNLP